jgi:hypothetical protein
VNSCVAVQEQIAWDRKLSEDVQMHILSCAECGQVAAEFASLDVWMSHYDVSIPSGFADKVMHQIDALEGTQRSGLFSSRWAELGLVSAGAAFAIWNLIQFVLAVLLPVLV